MAAENRQALLDIIDEAASVGELQSAFDEQVREFLSLRARFRVCEGRLAGRPEVQRKLVDVMRQLKAFEQSRHADVLKAHQRAERQRREIDRSLTQLHEVAARIEEMARDLLLDDWPDGIFDESAGWRYLGVASGDRTGPYRCSSGVDGHRWANSRLGEKPSPRTFRLTQWRQRADQAKIQL